MSLYSCGGLRYPRLIDVKDKKAKPAVDDLSGSLNYFSQGERVANGHPVLHLKGKYTLCPSVIQLPGIQNSLKRIPSSGEGTTAYRPDLWAGPQGPYALVGESNVPLDGSGTPIGLWFGDTFSDGIEYYGTAGGGYRRVETILHDFEEGSGNLCWYSVTNRRWNKTDGSEPSYEYTTRQYGIKVGDSTTLIAGDCDKLYRLLLSRIRNLCEDMLEGYEPMFHGNYSYICADACEGIRYPHHNVVMNTMEVLNFNTSVADMYKSWKSLADNPTIKGGAAAYLGTKYGPKLTLQELGDILNHERSYEKVGTSTATREGTWSYYLFNFKCVDRVSFSYHFGVYNTIMNTLSSWGLSPPTLVDVWDAVPYSFVVDWFVNIADILENPGRRSFMDSLPTSNIWRSEKSTATGSIDSKDLMDSVRYSFTLYTREYQSSLGTRLSGYSPSSGITAQNHLPEIGAVLVNLLT